MAAVGRVGKATTIRDVAAAAGVSMGTVSRVAAGSSRISEPTRARVLEVMRDLAYQPNAAARAMRTNVSKTIGLLIPDMTCPIFVQVAVGAEEVLSRRGYMLFTFSSNRQESREVEFLNAARQRQMDGLIVSVTDETSAETTRQLSAMQVPIVVLDRELPIDADVVLNEHYAAMSTLMANLISLGHSRIGLICAPQSVRPGRERVRAYRDALAKAAIALDARLLRAKGQGDAFGAFEAHDLLTGAEPPTAMIAAGSDTFYGALRAVRALRLEIPRDLSFAGADNGLVGEITGPAITMIERDMREAGRRAANLLLDRFADAALPQRRLLLTSDVVLRDSTGPAHKQRCVSIPDRCAGGCRIDGDGCSADPE